MSIKASLIIDGVETPVPVAAVQSAELSTIANSLESLAVDVNDRLSKLVEDEKKLG
jgi:hypothetical protein